jgi:AAA+ ATPase superfamily predicted ATPase
MFITTRHCIMLQPFRAADMFSVLDNLTSLSLEEKLRKYFLFGGIIHYYFLFEKFSCTTFSDILEMMIYSEFVPLRREISDILVEESGSEHASYHAIIAALAGGKTSMKEIGDRAGIAVTSLHLYFDNLINLLGIVTYQVPAGDEKGRSRLGRYYLKDPFFRFYALFVYPKMSALDAGNFSSQITAVHDGWDSYAGKCFEDLVREVIVSDRRYRFDSVGSWWNRKGDEIDLVAGASDRTLAVECKNRVLTEDQARDIIRRTIVNTERIPHLSRPVTCGVAARSIQGKENLQQEGFFAWDVQDFSSLLKHP